MAAAVQSRRGENRLHRRSMIVRQRLYRRRFAHALGPAPVNPQPGVRGRGRAPARAPHRTHEGRPRPTQTLPRIPAPRHPRGHRPHRDHHQPGANPGPLRRVPAPQEHTMTAPPAGARRPLPDAASRERRGHPPHRPQVRGAAGRRPGHGQERPPCSLSTSTTAWTPTRRRS